MSTALGVTLVLVPTMLLSGCAATPTGALSRLAHLDQGTPVADHIVPPVVPHVDSDLVDSTVRLLAEQDGTAFWVGATSSDDVCFIAAPAPAELQATPSPTATSSSSSSSSSPSSAAPSSAPVAADGGFGPPVDAPVLPVPSLVVDEPEAVCLSPETFGSHGAVLRLGAEGTRVWLHTEYMTVGTGWVPIAQNIAVKS